MLCLLLTTLLMVICCHCYKISAFSFIGKQKRIIQKWNRPISTSQTFQRMTDDHQSTYEASLSIAPINGKAVDYVESSRRASNVFVEFDKSKADSYVTVKMISKSNFSEWSNNISNETHEFLNALGFSLKNFPGTKILSVPGLNKTNITQFSAFAFYDEGTIMKLNYKAFDGLWSSLKENKTYIFQNQDLEELDGDISNKLATSYALSTYKFSKFKSKSTTDLDINTAKVVWPTKGDKAGVLSLVRALTLMKDLITTPALSLGPSELEQVALSIGKETGAIKIESIVGVKLLVENNYPQIAAVGMGAVNEREPRIVDMRWSFSEKVSDESISGIESNQLSSDIKSYPEVVLVGKGVTFDTGGLNIKGAGMRMMKVDMTGAAQALALALWIVETKLPVNLRLLLPIAENSISGIALRPGDVIRARNGKTTEVTNTDAEGRLILADALSAAVELPNKPVLLVDFATLTGAARSALGTELGGVFSNNIDELQKLWNISNVINDPVWMLPLYEPMRPNIKSSIADLVNAADG